tara:strand:+ start:732 stop:950 length:219 start_codon:yes stop_codon:yes gene_type:complete
MFTELLMMNGYGQYVWTAFIFSFGSCLYLYLKIRIEFKKLEKVYLIEFNKMEAKKIQFNKRKKSTEEAVPIN